MTIGNTVNGVGEQVHTSPRRQRLVTDHEDVHVWQGRWFGPLYPLLYGGWMVAGAVAGTVVWTLRRREAGLAQVVDTCAYYLNPFEWWAYSRDGHWPPTNKVVGLGWRHAVRAAAQRDAAPPDPSSSASAPSSAALKASGASCWVQCPAPSISTVPRWFGRRASIAST